MRITLITLCLLFSLSLTAQNYYVALVKGKVYYEDVLLKPRTKIELKGNLRFTTKDDYVKVSGPGGIHTIRPVAKKTGGYEFLRAVTQELFPAAKPRGSFVLSAWLMPGDAIGIYSENQYHPNSFVAGERVDVRNHLKKKKQQKKVYWVGQLPKGKLTIVQAKVVRGRVELPLLRPAVIGSPEAETMPDFYLFYLEDLAEFNRLVDKFSLLDVFWASNADMQPAGGQANSYAEEMGVKTYLESESDGTMDIYLPYPQIVGLGWLSPDQVVDREEVFGEMLYYFLESGETSVGNFLLGSMTNEQGDYSEILRELYGEMNFSRVADAFVDYLREHRKDSPRIKELWKLNKR
jgi:hypothetical protein